MDSLFDLITTLVSSNTTRDTLSASADSSCIQHLDTVVGKHFTDNLSSALYNLSNLTKHTREFTHGMNSPSASANNPSVLHLVTFSQSSMHGQSVIHVEQFVWPNWTHQKVSSWNVQSIQTIGQSVQPEYNHIKSLSLSPGSFNSPPLGPYSSWNSNLTSSSSSLDIFF